MGLKDFQQILALLQRWFPQAFWPRYETADGTQRASSSSSLDGSPHPLFQNRLRTTSKEYNATYVRWPPQLSSIGIAIDEFNGTVRGLPLGTKAQRKMWTEEAKRAKTDPSQTPSPSGEEEDFPEEDGDEEGGGGKTGSGTLGNSASTSSLDQDLEDIPPIATPEDLLLYLFDRYSKIFFYNNARELHVVWDYIGRTPAIKAILRQPVPAKPIVWPADHSTLFTSNQPFQNSIHDFFADKEARKLLYDYLTTSLLERFPTEGYLPLGSRIVLWGGYYKGQECRHPLYVENDALTGLSPEPIEMEDLDAPCAEADVMIAYIVWKNLGKHHQILFSKDSDFIPILLSVVNQAYKSDAIPDPKKYRVFLSHKILIKHRVPLDDFANLQKDLEQLRLKQEQEAKKQQQQQQNPDQDLWNEEDDPFLRELLESDPTPVEPPPMALKSPPPSSIKNPGKAPNNKRKKNDDGKMEIKAKIREVIDMNEMYERVWSLMYSLHEKCGKCDPIDAFVGLLFMSGCDYYKNPPLVTFKVLCNVYFGDSGSFHRRFGCLCPYDVQAPVFRLNLGVFKTLLARAYKSCSAIKNTQIADESYEYICSLLHKRKAEADRAKTMKAPIIPPSIKMGPTRKAPDRLPPLYPERYAANVHWLVNYYTRSHLPGWKPTNGLERDPDSDLSLHGYVHDPETRTYHFATKVLIRDVF